jgi:hypothetical protein
MNKRQLIDDIRQFNTRVQPEFLAQFDDQALEEYLDHLRAAYRKHVDMPSWIRQKTSYRMVG